ncbi:hypothetical protein K1T71_000330 [Dendrolimus kikuchii]|uniref:Uncharacterized protein n=1 Tax=Dendrolimus kikuchii TaxID=765133 RepID=A0ACC1DKG0_9NEOP|nr:hypothetical protein K1T71_000330 [Dendrolimus kikuchii]
MYSKRHLKAYCESSEDSADEQQQQPIQPMPLSRSQTSSDEKLPELIIEKEPPPPNKRKIDEDFFDKLIKKLKTEEVKQNLMKDNEHVKSLNDNENGETANNNENGENINNTEKN